MRKERYLWVTILPLSWLLAVTLTAGWQKIFATDIRLGFLSAARHFEKLVATGGSARDLAAWQHQIFNNYLNASVTALFLILVILIVASCARVWVRLLAGLHEQHPLREEASVA
jgi:carbon starvation protein